jgi:2-amino-4-hydroxy-6-hydroxymethyldihydropteridine diphosphokinase
MRARLDAAIDALDALPGYAVVARSRFYRTPPWGVLEQPPFVNAAIAVETSLPRWSCWMPCWRPSVPSVVFAMASAGGRARWIWICWHGEGVIDDERLTVPHPRMAERAFVLLPLNDIARRCGLARTGRVATCWRRIDT